MLYTNFRPKKGRGILVFIIIPIKQAANQFVKTLIRKEGASVDFIHM